MHISSKAKSLRTYTLCVLLSSTMLLTACGSSGGGATAKQIALNKIIAFAEDGSNPAPSLQDYIDAGVGGLNNGSLADFNALVDGLVKEDVDTTAEIDALVATPIAMPVSATTDEDTPEDITLVGLEFDGDALSYSEVIAPANGSINITGNIATYTPNANYNGSDSFTYKANDGTDDSNTETVSITITAVNDAPTANAVSATTNEDTAKAIALNATDAEGDALSYNKVTDPAHGSISIAGNTASYTPDANYNGSDSFTYKANDGTDDSNTETVSITINAVNDAPTANAGADADADVIEGQTLTLAGSGADVDTGDTLTYSWSPATNLDNANIAQPTFTAPAISADATQVYTLTVTDSAALTATDTVTISALNLPAQPQNVQLTAGNTQLTLNWDSVADAAAYDICLATETISTPANCASIQNGALHLSQNSPATLTGLTNGTLYYFVVIPKNANGSGVVSAEVTATPSEPVQPTPTGLLNDTGISLCGDYAYDGSGTLIAGHTHSNSESCANIVDTEGDPIPAGQDGHLGRDVTHNDNSDGNAGFNFTKLNAAGIALINQATTYATTPWNCVKDNVTGLIWEVKTTSGLHNKNDRYTWYNTDATTNGGAVGYARQSDSSYSSPNDNTCSGYVDGTAPTYCNTQAYVARVNAEAYCGATDWRMPTREELRSVVDYDVYNPSIDTAYFPNTVSSVVWSSSPFAGNSHSAWSVYFYFGYDLTNFKYYYSQVRLVRSGQ